MKRAMIVLLCVFSGWSSGQVLLLPMDLVQTDHLKAYGVAYWALEQGITVDWLLNFRGGSFLIGWDESVVKRCRIRGVQYETLDGNGVAMVYAAIDSANMESMRLEKAPAIAVYTLPNKQPWDDAVTLALTYAEIPYKTLWDEEVLKGKLDEYDWLHLHHEDFTGQYGKFYASYRNATWYVEEQRLMESEAKRLGYAKVSQLKLEVAERIRDYVVQGGFLFAMCSATDSYDIALAGHATDICESVFDGDPADPDCQKKLTYDLCFAFENFQLITDPLVYEFSDIDTTPLERSAAREARNDYFTLFSFSAKYDPVPTMLTQDHVSVIHNFMGQTSGFHRNRVKGTTIVMAEKEGTDEIKYLHGNIGRGTFTFLGGHDPEDYQHFVGDPPTELALHKNSPGYRLILNNILFPAAEKKKQKT
jgi:hypothetical protein